MSVIQKKADEISKALAQVGGVGFDPASILAALTMLFKLFQDCGLPATKAVQRMKALATSDRFYFGRNVDENRLEYAIDQSGLVSDSLPRSVVIAAFKDSAGATTAGQVRDMYAEARALTPDEPVDPQEAV